MKVAEKYKKILFRFRKTNFSLFRVSNFIALGRFICNFTGIYVKYFRYSVYSLSFCKYRLFYSFFICLLRPTEIKCIFVWLNVEQNEGIHVKFIDALKQHNNDTKKLMVKQKRKNERKKRSRFSF